MTDWPNDCKERDAIENGPLEPGYEAGETLPHCFHDMPDDYEHAPGLVCCFCGDLFEPDEGRATKHGPYATKAVEHDHVD